MAETVLRVEHVGMRFNLSKERVDSLKDYILKSITRQMKFDEFWALKDINFTLEKGERIGMLVTALQKFTLNVKRRNYEFSCTRSFKKIRNANRC